jgi:hypothetical protein
MELGLFSLNPDPNGPRWIETPLAAQFKGYVEDSADSIGFLHERPTEVTV